MVTTGADISNIGIKIIPLFDRFVIISNVFVLNLALEGRFIIKSMDISYQIR